MDRLIEVERREDGVALVRMVDEAGDNAMSPRFVAELLAVQGSPVEIDGYYSPDAEKVSAAMRPSATLNAVIDAL